MAVHGIIRKLQDTGLGYINKSFYLPVLFYADDSLVLSNDRKEMEDMMSQLREIVKESGLEISKLKSKCLILNRDNRNLQNQSKLAKIEVVDTVKYLGIELTEGRNYLSEHKKRKINMARKIANMTSSIIARSCNRLMVGKTY